MYREQKLWDDLTWTSVVDVNEADLDKLQQKFKLPHKYRSYLLDPRERSRFDYNDGIKTGLLIWRVAVAGQQAHSFQVVPVSFIVAEKHLISIVSSKAKGVQKELEELLAELTQEERKASLMVIMLRLLWRINNQYVDQIDEINKRREELAVYRKHPSNPQIEALSRLSDQLVYLTTAADNNVVAIQQMKLSSNSASDEFQMDQRERDFLDDVEVETKQSQQITQDAAELVDRLSNTYNNILNNTLNDTMKFLTIWSLILAVPPIVSGFYGMNMHLPWARGEFAWVGTLVMTLALIVLTMWVYYHHRSK
ncbi:magnesium and cobalt transporter [Ligilactobacillus salitolerans]|uniref:Magnesium and cobalt transporter n=1 Tax=Ligilactobacillus salitolerans TaxID=1808352 RepID=A0A401IRT6_9LACO|nr:magnesium transporter CorA family protein [Ligilactobacillus salitolerans]GBG94249.1 magnesium and cobalt transporter [Ligilactobacillus salitolerans]